MGFIFDLFFRRWYIRAIFNLADYFWLISTRYSLFFSQPGSPNCARVSFFYTDCCNILSLVVRHILIDPAAAYTFTGLLQNLFSLLAVLSPLFTDLFTSVREKFNPTSASPFILWLMVFLYMCRWASLLCTADRATLLCVPYMGKYCKAALYKHRLSFTAFKPSNTPAYLCFNNLSSLSPFFLGQNTSWNPTFKVMPYFPMLRFLPLQLCSLHHAPFHFQEMHQGTSSSQKFLRSSAV